MPIECNPVSMRFARLKGRDVVADFGGGAVTSDAGTLLLRTTDRAISLVDQFSDCLPCEEIARLHSVPVA